VSAKREAGVVIVAAEMFSAIEALLARVLPPTRRTANRLHLIL
jgi:hypothetical protein